ncbi:hypothetical protein D1007_32664 [Hordeum vulgare]|nr:hypothetical protein D1007_32664 [Hordeum vulgare]
MPETHVDERVVSGTHFVVGIGLPASRFLRQILDFFGLQMHHVGPNSVLYLTCLATLCEGVKEGQYWVNLRLFTNTPSIGMNWSLDLRNDEMTFIAGRLKELQASKELMPADLMVAFISFRVLPLQERPPLIYDMSLRKDPCWFPTVELLPGKIDARVNAITRFRPDEEVWWFDMEPLYRGNRASQDFDSEDYEWYGGDPAGPGDSEAPDAEEEEKVPTHDVASGLGT